jgi:hypothetical protein
MRFVPVEAMRSRVCDALWRWYENAGGSHDSWPPRSAFRPEDLPGRVLPHLGVVDVERDPFRVYYRLLGSAIADSLGRTNLRGYLDEMGLPQEAEVAELYRYALQANRPLFLAGDQVIDGQAFTYEGGALPLGAPDDPRRRFIIFEDYLNSEAWRSALRRRRYRPDED